MKNIALNMVTAFILSMLAGYWVPLLVSMKWNGLDSVNSEPIQITPFQTPHFIKEISRQIETEESYIAPIFESFPTCDPFLDKNMCILATPLQNLLKTSSQKNQYLYVLRKLDELQMPHNLALIPLIESQYNPYALSPKGAAGVWQLMPDTAKNYGLLDHQRFELEASTQAALQFLKELHDQFGSWELAIAAYNAGSKRVQNALLQNPSAKNVHELSLPSETKKYMSSFNQMQFYFK